MPPKKHRVLITNPQPIVGGQPDMVVKGVVAKGYIIVPIDAGLFEVYMGNKYLGEAEGDVQIKKLIERDGASAPVLIQNPNGGYEMYNYTRPTGNPKKKRKKAAKKKKKAVRRKAPRKAKKKAGKKRSKVAKRKKNAKRKAPRKAKKKAGKVSPRKKKRISKAKKKVKSAKKAVRKAKSALSKAKRSPNPTANPRKKKRKSSKKRKVSHAPREKATQGDINAYVKQVTGKKF